MASGFENNNLKGNFMNSKNNSTLSLASIYSYKTCNSNLSINNNSSIAFGCNNENNGNTSLNYSHNSIVSLSATGLCGGNMQSAAAIEDSKIINSTNLETSSPNQINKPPISRFNKNNLFNNSSTLSNTPFNQFNAVTPTIPPRNDTK